VSLIAEDIGNQAGNGGLVFDDQNSPPLNSAALGRHLWSRRAYHVWFLARAFYSRRAREFDSEHSAACRPIFDGYLAPVLVDDSVQDG